MDRRWDAAACKKCSLFCVGCCLVSEDETVLSTYHKSQSASCKNSACHWWHLILSHCPTQQSAASSGVNTGPVVPTDYNWYNWHQVKLSS